MSHLQLSANTRLDDSIYWGYRMMEQFGNGQTSTYQHDTSNRLTLIWCGMLPIQALDVLRESLLVCQSILLWCRS